MRTCSREGCNKPSCQPHGGYCREHQTEYQRQWRERNLEKARELSRESKRRQREREGPKATRQKWNDWYARNAGQRSAYTQERKDPLKVKAQNKVNKAVASGRLLRPGRCSQCGEECKPDAHHADYSKPLEVEWLCRRCHRLRQ